MTDRWGIDDRYDDTRGLPRTVPEDVIDRLRDLVGLPDEDAVRRAPLFVRRGEVASLPVGDLLLEDGGEVALDGSGDLPEDVPIGYHRFRPRDTTADGAGRAVIVSPRRCFLPDGWRAWGWAVQLYAARSRASWGIGDLGDLATISEWSGDQLGAGLVMINPLHAAAPGTPQEPSPYSPISRRFFNPLAIRIEDVPGATLLGPELELLAEQGRALNASRAIDRDAVLDLKMKALGLVWERARPADELDGWIAGRGAELTEFATWCVLAERFGGAWREWPEEYRRPDAPQVAALAADQADRVRFHCWLQWLTSAQLERAGGRLAVIQDLPIGFDPSGADAWSWQDLVAGGASVGAPPDEFNTAGQDWGLPPFVPWRLRAAGYRPFIETVRATMPRGGGLRIDHVMGLFRQWWVPRGESPRAGGYVRYPTSDLLDIIAIESERAGALVVGEDLGTVEPGVREEMAARRILSYRLLWFEDDDPAQWPASSMAAVSTHDLPTVAGLWTGSDVQRQRGFGLDASEGQWKRIRARVAGAADLADDAPVEDAIEGAYRVLGRAPSVLLSATLDDAAAEPERPNLPGVVERANWCLALASPLEELMEAPLPVRIADSLRGAVG